MNVTAESYGQAILLNLRGELTEDGLATFQKAVDHQLEDTEVIDVVLNMEEVPFVDSAGLECLLDLQDRLSERLGQVKLAKLDESVEKILEITRLKPMIDVYEESTDAVKSAQA